MDQKIIVVMLYIFTVTSTLCRADELPSFDFDKRELKERLAAFFDKNHLTIMVAMPQCGDGRPHCEARLTETLTLAVTQTRNYETHKNNVTEITVSMDTRKAPKEDTDLFDILCPSYLAIVRKQDIARANELYDRISRQMLNRWDGSSIFERHQKDKTSHFEISGGAGYLHCRISADIN